MHRLRRLQCASATQAGNRRTVNEFSMKNLVYNINQIKFALDSRADRRDRSFFKAKWFIL